MNDCANDYHYNLKMTDEQVEKFSELVTKKLDTAIELLKDINGNLNGRK